MHRPTGNKTGILFLVTALLALSFIAGCKKEPNFLSNIDISPTVTSFQFEPGSYWVYELEGDTLEDSVYIMSAEAGEYRFLAEENEEEIWEFYKTERHSTYQDEDYFEVISQDMIRRGAGDVDSTRIGGELLFAGEAIEGEIRYSSDNWSLEAVGEVENLQAGNLLWPEALAFVAYEPDNPINGRDRLFYVKEVGLVRIEKDIADSTAQTWNLAGYRTILVN